MMVKDGDPLCATTMRHPWLLKGVGPRIQVYVAKDTSTRSIPTLCRVVVTLMSGFIPSRRLGSGARL